MASDLDNLRSEIESYLEQSKLAAFRGFDIQGENATVYWDVKQEPDFHKFLQVAEKAGARLIVFHQQLFALDEIDELREQIEASSLPRDEQRNFEHKIRELQKYEGFLARIQLSFSQEGKDYIYEMEADWYRAWQDLVTDVELLAEVPDDLNDDGSISGYFSSN